MAYNQINPTAVNQDGFVGGYNQSYIDTYSLAGLVPEFKEQILPRLYKTYGRGFDLFNFVRLAGNEFFVKGEKLTAFEEAMQKTSATIAAVSPADTTYNPGDPIYIQLSSDDYGSNDERPLRIGDVVYIPGVKFGKNYPVATQVTAIDTTGTFGSLTAGTGTDTVYTLKTFDNTLDISEAIGTATIVIGHTAFGRGAGQPEGKFRGVLQRSFLTGIAKDTVTIEGGINAMERQEVFTINGQPTIWDKGLIDVEFSLDRQIAMAVMLGQENNNVALTNTENGTPTKTKSTKGFLPIVDALGQKLVLNTTFEYNDFDGVRDLHLSQGCIAKEYIIIASPKLYTQIENSMTAVLDNGSGSLYDAALQTMGVAYKRIIKNNRIYYLIEDESLANPYALGADGFGLNASGFVIPLEMVSTEINGQLTFGGETFSNLSGKVMLPNIGVGYLSNNGEDRRRIIAPVAGVNGMGLPASHQYDKASIYLLSEFMFMFMKPNEIVWIK